MTKPTDDLPHVAPCKEKVDDVEECKMEEEESMEVPSSGNSIGPVSRQGQPYPPLYTVTSEVVPHQGNTSGWDENAGTGNEKTEQEGPREEPTTSINNKDFDDFRKTGRWGAISKTEVTIVTFMTILIAVIVTVVVVIFVGGSDNDDTPGFSYNNNNGQVPKRVNSPILTADAQEELIVSTVEKYPFLKRTWYENEGDLTTTTNNPLRLAASWIVHDDPVDFQDDIVLRFALAAIYYATGGDDWLKKDGWLTETPVCNDGGGWYGIKCNPEGEIVNLEMRNNNLTGEIPLALVLLQNLQALWLDENEMTGHLPDDLFTRMPDLQFLYVQYNKLDGPIPLTLLDNGYQLRTFFIQGNSFTGTFPEHYCPSCPECEHPLLAFGINCRSNICNVPKCCDPDINCFNG